MALVVPDKPRIHTSLGFGGGIGGIGGIGGFGGGKLDPAILPRDFPSTHGLRREEKDSDQDDEHGSGSSLLYHRPTFTVDDRLFYDLVTYAPGLNTSAADILAVLEAEAIPDAHAKPGRIDDATRCLLDKARTPGWQALTVPAHGTRPGYTIHFDDKGRYTYERILPPGLKERVVCDGKTLLHLYSDLGLGARHSVSRFHRADFAELVPWLVPPAEDLARGADLRLIDDHTIALVPHGAASGKGADGKPKPYHEVRFVFAGDGRLAERQVVCMPAGKVLYRETIAADGTVKLLDDKGKELAVRKGTLAAASEPSLKADTDNLVILDLPYRGRDHVLETLKIKDKPLESLRFADARALLAADFAAGNGDEALAVFKQSFHRRDQRQLGLYVLLAACGQNLDGDHVDVLAEHLDAPLAQYLALHSSPLLRKHASQWAVAGRQWSGGFLQHLALSHALYQRWQNNKVVKGSLARVKAERERALDYVRRNKGTLFGWALLGLLQDRAGKDQDFHRALAEAWLLFEDVPGLGYAARYENARSLWKSGQAKEARRRFQDLYEKTLKQDRLPPIDADFRLALLEGGKEEDRWGDLLRPTAADLIKKKHRPAVLALAWQFWQLEDRPLANHLLAAALKGAPEKERLALTLAGIGFLMETSQLAEADGLLQKLLDDPKLARRPALWRLKARLAEERDRAPAALAALEQALEYEYQDLPAVIDLRAVRADYGKLLEHYQLLADAMVTLRVAAPADFKAKVVRAADRWRALDREAEPPCRLAGRILQTLGDRALSWDYLTTPVGLRPNEAAPWLDLARTLSRQGDLDLADRAYTAAFEAEPTDAQILWDRAQNLRQAGKTVRARELFRQIADGKWQPRFAWLQTQARWQLQGR
jgi:predicted Zn-dependent protease